MQFNKGEIIMRKLTLLLAAGVLCASVLTGCSDKTGSTSESSGAQSQSGSAESSSEGSASSESTSASNSSEAAEDTDYEIITGDYKAEDCVKLPEYKGIKLTKTVYEISDEYVSEYIASLLTPVEVDDPDATLQEGDTARISYEGTIDGVAFDGGSSDSTDLELGSGRFIEGFEDGLIGLKKGDEVDLNLKFPDDYYNSEYAGKDVVFHVEILAVCRNPEQDDEWVKDYTDGEYTTMDDYREYARKYLEDTYADQTDASLHNDAWTEVYDKTDFVKLPQSLIDAGGETYDLVVQMQASQYGFEDAYAYYEAMGYSKEQADQYMAEAKEQYGANFAKNIVFGEAILAKEGIATDGEEVQAMYKTLEDNYQMTLDELKETYNDDWVYMYGVCSVANDILVDNADVTEKVEVMESEA